MISTNPARKLTHRLQDVLDGLLRRDPDQPIYGDLDRILGRAQALADAVDEDPRLGEALAAFFDALLGASMALQRTVDDATGIIDSHAFVRIRALDGLFDQVRDYLTDISAETDARTGRKSADRVMVVGSAGWLAAVAARLLPTSDRARYTEEFGGELWDLAGAEVRRWRQIAHAVRLLTRAGRLRLELRAPYRRKASP